MNCLGARRRSSSSDALKETHPKVVDELVPGHLSLGGVMRVLQNLLSEQVSIRDLLTIIEAMADWAPSVKQLEHPDRVCAPGAVTFDHPSVPDTGRGTDRRLPRTDGRASHRRSHSTHRPGGFSGDRSQSGPAPDQTTGTVSLSSSPIETCSRWSSVPDRSDPISKSWWIDSSPTWWSWRTKRFYPVSEFNPLE